MKYPDGEEVNYTYHPQLTLNSVAGLDNYVKATMYDAAGRVDLRELGLSSGQAVVKTDYGYYPWPQQGGRLQKDNPTATPEEFLKFLESIYKEYVLQERFPNGYEIIQLLLDEIKYK